MLSSFLLVADPISIIILILLIGLLLMYSISKLIELLSRFLSILCGVVILLGLTYGFISLLIQFWTEICYFVQANWLSILTIVSLIAISIIAIQLRVFQKVTYLSINKFNQKKAKNLASRNFLAFLHGNFKENLFFPSGDISYECVNSRTKYYSNKYLIKKDKNNNKKTFVIYGISVDFSQEKIIEAQHSIDELSAINEKSLSQTKDIYEKQRYKYFYLLKEIIYFRNEILPPVLDYYRRIAISWRNHSDNYLNSDVISSSEIFLNARKEIYDIDKELRDIKQNKICNLFKKTLRGIKQLKNQYFLDELSEISNELEKMISTVKEYDKKRKIYNELPESQGITYK